MTSNNSRLDRLFVLLETGSSSLTRSAAAKQLGQVQKLHPHELHTLLKRTASFLRSNNWETRIAAAEAVRHIVDNVPQWQPEKEIAEKSEKFEPSPSNLGRLRFHQFDINKVLTNSTHLMASEGKEFDLIDEDSGNLEMMREKMAKQRQILNKRLGLDVASDMGIFDSSQLFTNDDLMPFLPATPIKFEIKYEDENKKSITEFIQNVTNQKEIGLSSREMNRAKRKARQAILNKQRSKDTEEQTNGSCSASITEEPDKKRIKIEAKEEISSNSLVLDEEIEVTTTEWPLEWFCDQLAQDLFSSSWETRHGAATALREIISVHGKGAGKSKLHQSIEEMELYHQIWLEDLSIRLLCVLALDRFGDFVSDAVVAPVRETCAQTLCAVLKLMNCDGCLNAMKILLELLKRENEWEARHGGLLGLKYLLAVRDDLVNTLLPEAFPFILQGLSDGVDDVAAVAAASLIPVVEKLVELVPADVKLVVEKLWDLLAEQDELAAACNSFMGLLAAILNLEAAQKLLPIQPLNDVVPRLWPFLNHSASSVRKATLQTLAMLSEKKEFENGSEDNEGNIKFEAQLLQDAMRHVFQRVLIESNADVRKCAEKVWENLVRNSGLSELLHAACPFITIWLFLSMQATRVSIDSQFLIQINKTSTSTLTKRKNNLTLTEDLSTSCCLQLPKCYIGGMETIPLAQREQNAIEVRCMIARMLGLLSFYIIQPAPGIDYSGGNIEKPIECYEKVLLVHLLSKSALQRMMCGLIVAEWAAILKIESTNGEKLDCPVGLKEKLHLCLNERIYFDEIALSFTRLTQDFRDFLATLKHYKVPIWWMENGVSGVTENFVYTLEKIRELTGNEMKFAITKFKLKTKLLENLEERRKSIKMAAEQTAQDQEIFACNSLAALAGAVVMFGALPERLTPVAKPLMESIRMEQEESLQKLSARNLAELLMLTRERQPCPNDKIIGNLCLFLRCDAEFTPIIYKNGDDENFNGILTLNNQQKSAEKAATFKRSNSSTGRGPGRPPNNNSHQTSNAELDEAAINLINKEEDEANKKNKIQRRGATLALIEIVKKFGDGLPEKLPKLWEIMIETLQNQIDPDNFNPNEYQSQIDQSEQLLYSLQVLEVTTKSLHSNLKSIVMDKCLKRLCMLLSHPFKAIRHLAARCLAVFAQIDSVLVMESIVSIVLPKLAHINVDIDRQGAVEALACIIETLQFEIIPFVVLLIVPLLGRMSDSNQCVRLMGTHSFATLVQLMPLDGGVPEPPKLRASCLNERREKEREFLSQLLSPQTIPDYKIPVPIQAELRSYQQAGVNWLAFLNKYKLHGILCDDMGLGKTLQSICMLAADHFNRDEKYKKDKSVDCAPLPSLVICPPTLTGHWVYEVEKFLSHKYLKPLQYNGSPTEREKLRSKFKKHNLIVASYDIVRKDIQVFNQIKWNYIILDEGHVIKNGKTRTSMAIKSLVANYRLILSGTPIQNNVLELWSLFDFLMPGFLGTEKQFMARYFRPILASRDPKSLPKEQEAGVLAMESLHRQVLPFLLRRNKEDVLDDLPPKITQDYYCELSWLQERLYEDFAKSQAHQTLEESLKNSSCRNEGGAAAGGGGGGGGTNQTHIFQALRYLQNVCNHPKLVLNGQHPQFMQIVKELEKMGGKLDDITNSAKLPALKQLLQDCGIGVNESTNVASGSNGSGTSVSGNSSAASASGGNSTDLMINQHRALIFCQLKGMLDIIEKDLFKKHMKSVTYLRLDGSIPSSQRHSVVTTFNNDPSIDVLLLTTQVGGLGLNLTGADTVIFVEHDWNPMKDLQAMDRAHRIGQRKVVNVYRLITRGTLEEKIMGLQKFKVQTVNTIISGNNSKLETMGTEQLLDLFSHKNGGGAASGNDGGDKGGSGGGGSVRNILETLPELWDQKQYDDEYDLSQFISKLK